MSAEPLAEEPEGPYAAAAYALGDRGWNPLPVRRGEKHGEMPSGFSGYAGRDVHAADVERWLAQGRGVDNIMLRVPKDVVGIDVDAYGGKPGGATFAALEQKYGPLPATWVVSSRFGDGYDGVSGIRLYRLPDEDVKDVSERVWRSGWPGVDAIRWAHRYVAAPPSIHHTGRTYLVLDQVTGEITTDMPAVSELPVLPDAWAQAMRKPEPEQVGRQQRKRRDTKPAEPGVRAVSQWWTEGEPCGAVEGRLAMGIDAMAGGRHDAVRDTQTALTRLGEQGHRGVRAAVDRLRQALLEERQADGDDSGPDEWERMAGGVDAEIERKGYTPVEDRRCCGGIPAATTLGTPGHLPESFWDSHSTLTYLREYAYSRRLRPESVLGSVLAYVNARIPAEYVLPDFIASLGSLNLVVVTYGRSGLGKSGSAAAAERITGTRREVWEGEQALPNTLMVTPLGSGEGLAQAWFEWVTETITNEETGKTSKRTRLTRVRDNVLVLDPEGSGLRDQMKRAGATLSAVLLKMFSGEELAFAYSKRAGQGSASNVSMRPHSYRAAVLLGIQPDNVGAFLDLTGSGWPQRILWFTCEGTLPRERVPSPDGSLHWQTPPRGFSTRPVGWMDWDEPVAIEVSETVMDHLVERADAYRAQTGDDLDSHGGMVRLKTAATLHALLYPDLPPAVTEETWALAEIVATASEEVRDEARNHVHRMKHSGHRERDEQAAKRAVWVATAVADAAVVRVAKVLYRIADRHATQKGDDHVCAGSACLRRGVASDDRGDRFSEALEHALAEGWLVELPGDDGSRYRPGNSAPRGAQ